MYSTIYESLNFVYFPCPLLALKCDISRLIPLKFIINLQYVYPQKLALTSPTGGGRSVGIVRVRTKTTEFSLVKIQVVPHSEGSVLLLLRAVCESFL